LVIWDHFHVINELPCNHLNMERLGWTCISLLTYFKLDFKDIVLSCLDELLGLSNMDENFKMSSFQPNLNSSEFSFVAPDIV
jgi:hypothetical protein